MSEEKKASAKLPSYQQAYLAVYAAAITGLAQRVPFGLEVGEDQIEEIVSIAEDIADAGVQKLLENIVLDDCDLPEDAKDDNPGDSASPES